MFINKKLDDRDLDFFKSFGFKNPLGNLPVKIPTQMSIDEKNGFCLFCLGGRGHSFRLDVPPYYYVLIIDGIPVHIKARYDYDGDFSSGVIMKWMIESINFPVSAGLLQSEVDEVVKSALTSYGNIHLDGHVIRTTFI